jgi:hypothetical protein
MPNRHAIVPLFLLSTFAALASAASSPVVKGTVHATEVCATPTKAQCKDGKYLLSDCGQQHLTDCKATILAQAKADPARAKAPKSKMLKVGGSDIPGDLKDSVVRRSYTKPKKGKSIEVAGKNVLARSGLTKAPGLALSYDAAANAHRNPEWDTNGEEIHSCQEYAYEELYDGMQYIDAVAACAGDYACEFRIAYLEQTPGIARRTLKRKDGKKLYTQISVDKVNSFPKNDMFTTMGNIAYAVDVVADGTKQPDGTYTFTRTKEQDQLAKALSEGAKFYSYGCTSNCGKRKFKDEWGFHEKMNERNQLTDAEFAEYESRKAEFRELYDAWAASAGEGLHKLEKGVEKTNKMPALKKVMPIDMVSADPMERIDTMTNRVNELGLQSVKARGALKNLPNVAGQPAMGAMAAVGVLAAPVAKRPTVAKKQPSITVSRCSPLHWTQRSIDPNIADLAGGGPASCRLADFLKAELARKAKGQKSCLDLSDDDCDWSPTTFHGRFVASFPYGDQLQGYEEDCTQWTGGTIDITAATSGKGSELVKAEKYIDKMQELVGDALEVVGGYHEGDTSVEGKNLWKLGRDYGDSEVHGDKDWFAAGYDYDLGWHIQPLDLAGDQRICDFTGSAHGSFGADAWLIGSDKSVIDGSLYMTSNASNSGKSTMSAKLEVLGDQLFYVPEATFTKAWTPKEEADSSVQIPSGWKPTFEFMAGPVPITGSVWGSLMYGATASADAKLASTTSKCDADSIKFMVDGTVAPFFMVSGYAEVGVGVAGIASAGIRGMLNLVTVSLPFDAKLEAKTMSVMGNNQASVAFDASLSLLLSTLSGKISLYIEFLFASEEWELFSWSGLTDEIDLIDPAIHTELPAVGWPVTN